MILPVVAKAIIRDLVLFLNLIFEFGTPCFQTMSAFGVSVSQCNSICNNKWRLNQVLCIRFSFYHTVLVVVSPVFKCY